MNIIKFTKVTLGVHFGLALSTKGTVYQWGAINGTKSLEIHKLELNNVKDIYCGSYHAFAITTNGDVYGWGCNNFHQLGLTAFFQETPTKINLTDVLTIACGKYHSIFLHNDGQVSTIGHNLNGQLGLADKVCRSEFTRMKLTGVKSIACGYYHSLFLTDTGSVYSCGRNDCGQLGLKNVLDQDFVRRVDLNNVTNIFCGNYNSFCQIGDLTYAWGYNNLGQLGLNHISNTATPTVMGINIDRVFAAERHNFVVRAGTATNLTAYENYNGENLRTVPLTNFISIATTETFSAMISDCGDLFTWGYHNCCQLGYKIEQSYTSNPGLRIVIDRDEELIGLTPRPIEF